MTASRTAIAGAVFAVCAAAAALSAETATVTLRATVLGTTAPETLRIELMRWSTDAERAPLVKATTALNQPPAPPAAAAGAAGAGRGGRGGRAGRGRGPEPVSPLAQLTGAIKAAPTVGFIWGEGVSGYSIKYASRATQPDGSERIVLVIDRRLGAHSPAWSAVAAGARGDAAAAPAGGSPAAEAEFTVVEMRVDAKGIGEGKTSLTTRVAVDAATQTLTLDGYDAAPTLLKVMR
jgi:hypothetical protein